MKSLFTACIFLTSTFSLLTAQVWQGSDADFPAPLHGGSVYAINESVAWTWGWEQDENYLATGLNYTISKTTNNGDSWEQVTTPFTSRGSLTSIWALDADQAWMTYVSFTNGNLFYKTTDGGASWDLINLNVNEYIDFVYMWNSQEGIVVGDPDNMGPEIYKTTNGWNSWSRVSNVPFASGSEGVYGDNYRVRGDHVWYATTSGRIYHSPNRGNTWEVWNGPNSDLDPWLIEANDIGYVYMTYVRYDEDLGEYFNQLYRTTNSGQTWENIFDEEQRHYSNDIVAVPGSDAMVATFSGVLGFITRISQDRGTTWTDVDTESRAYLMDFYDTQTGYATDQHFYDNLLPTVVYQYSGSPLTGLIKNTPLENVELSISPNPASDVLNITLESISPGDYWISLSTVSGELIRKKSFTQVSKISHAIALNSLPIGAYMLTIANEKGVMTEKIIKL